MQLFALLSNTTFALAWWRCCILFVCPAVWAILRVKETTCIWGILGDYLETAKLQLCTISLSILGFVRLNFAELCDLNCQTDLIVHL